MGPYIRYRHSFTQHVAVVTRGARNLNAKATALPRCRVSLKWAGKKLKNYTLEIVERPVKLMMLYKEAEPTLFCRPYNTSPHRLPVCSGVVLGTGELFTNHSALLAPVFVFATIYTTEVIDPVSLLRVRTVHFT